MVNDITASQTILIVDDSDDDYEYMLQALRDSRLNNPLHRCEDGQEALDYLYDSNNTPRPGIILLDLNMPGVGGREVLLNIKNNNDLKDIPVVVLTTSSDEFDIEACYKDGANTYITKPVNMDNFCDAIKRLKEYWFELAILPKGEINHG